MLKNTTKKQSDSLPVQELALYSVDDIAETLNDHSYRIDFAIKKLGLSDLAKEGNSRVFTGDHIKQIRDALIRIDCAKGKKPGPSNFGGKALVRMYIRPDQAAETLGISIEELLSIEELRRCYICGRPPGRLAYSRNEIQELARRRNEESEGGAK